MMIVQLLINSQPKIIPFDQLHTYIASTPYGIDPNGNVLIFDVSRQVRPITDVVEMMSEYQSLVIPTVLGSRVFVPMYSDGTLNIKLPKEDRTEFCEILAGWVGFFDEKTTCISHICQPRPVSKYYYSETEDSFSSKTLYGLLLSRRESLWMEVSP